MVIRVKHSAYSFIALATVISLLSCTGAGDVSGAASTLAGIEALGQKLREVGNQMAEAGDQIAYNRIRQAEAELELLKPELEDVINGTAKNANSVVDNASENAVDILDRLRHDTSAMGAYGSVRLNSTLALTSQIVDKFIRVDPIILAVTPVRIMASSPSKEVHVYGYLPGAVGKDVKVFLNGELVSAVKRGVGNSLVFDLPAKLVVANGAPVSMRIEIRKGGGFFGMFRKKFELEEKLHIASVSPFACIMTRFKVNPGYLEEVKSETPAIFEASTQGGSNRPNENVLVPVEDLFTRTNPATVQAYDPNSMIIVSANGTLSKHGGTCGRGPKGSLTMVKSGHGLEVKLSAPHRSGKWDGVKRCDAGGTKITARISPVYKAAKKDTPYLIEDTPITFAMGYDGKNMPVFAPENDRWAIHLQCKYQDSAESWGTGTMVINEKDVEDIGKNIVTKVANGRLIINVASPTELENSL